MNCLYKIISACIAKRIKSTLDSLIHENQTGFIPGRSLADNIRLLYDLIYETKAKNQKGMLLSIDFEKAFDTVSKSFTLLVFKRFGFGPNIIKWISILTGNSTSCVIQNGNLSTFFPNGRGCRQGDPVSPYLFLFVAEILAVMIRNNKNIKGIFVNNIEHKLGQYADDTQLFLDGSEQSLRNAITTLDEFFLYSGLKINLDKTKAIWLGSMVGKDLKLCEDINLDWGQGNFEILGIQLNAKLENLWVINTRRRIDHIKRLLASWRKRNLTLIGKITVIKTLALSTLVHIFSALPRPPKDFIDEINSIFYKFIWNSKPDKIKRTNLTRNYDSGGLRMVDINVLLIHLSLISSRKV